MVNDMKNVFNEVSSNYVDIIENLVYNCNQYANIFDTSTLLSSLNNCDSNAKSFLLCEADHIISSSFAKYCNETMVLLDKKYKLILRFIELNKDREFTIYTNMYNNLKDFSDKIDDIKNDPYSINKTTVRDFNTIFDELKEVTLFSPPSSQMRASSDGILIFLNDWYEYSYNIINTSLKSILSSNSAISSCKIMRYMIYGLMLSCTTISHIFFYFYE